jgi:hypothetical protein
MRSKRLSDRKAGTGAPARRRRNHRVPPAESELWPVWCRGELWAPEAARWLAGRCQLCAYSCPPPEGRRWLDKLAGLPSFLTCTNHPASPGRMHEVIPTETCRNFKAARWQPPRSKPARKMPASTTGQPDGKVRHIPVGHGLFAIVDAADYEKLSKYKWYGCKIYGRVYAARHDDKGRIRYMHREVVHAPKGTVVDHIDHNILNNRQCNLRVCTQAQNAANAGPRGAASGYVGVYSNGRKWRGGITCRGKHYYLGQFDDPIEAARARDRMAYKLHGPFAYLNFPEDFPQRPCHKRPSTRKTRRRKA